jgi:predicted CXXCH cytochrome family protein
MLPERGSRHRLRPQTLATLLSSLLFVPACTIESTDAELGAEGASVAAEQEALRIGCPSTPTTVAPVALAIEIDNGAGVPLKVRAGQPFYLNQIDIRASLTASVDEGVAGLDAAGDFDGLSWWGTKLRDTEPLASPNADGTFTRRRFYRGADWMESRSQIVIRQVDQLGRPTALPMIVDTGRGDALAASDTYFIRRFRAIQWTYDCATSTNCSDASHFQEEALVELRNARRTDSAFTFAPNTTALEVRWLLKPTRPYRVPVTQVTSSTYQYGASAELRPLTPAGPGGYYTPGQDITFQVTLRDGAGNRLHEEGSLPQYDDVVAGDSPAGIQYYRAFFDATTTYWRRKHRERMMIAQIIGPAQKIGPIRSVVPTTAFYGPVQTTALPSRDGVYAQFNTFPTADALFGGAADSTHAAWSRPISDTWTYHLPDDAEAGTYLVTLKGRRTYLGEDIPFTTTINIQVGSTTPTSATLTTGPCTTCHSAGASLGALLHANNDRTACAGCHAPLEPELEGPIFVRVHYIHARSGRFPASLAKCATCHLGPTTIQRTSKSACLSCHNAYPPSHVTAFGPITSSYVGGGPESFQQCSTTCHTTHPMSGL